MFDELNKSFWSTLKERTTSPFYGTFVITWLLWNWKIIFSIFFVSEKHLSVNRIEYVGSLLNIKLLLFYPILSTAVILFLMPFITINVYRVYLYFERWKRNIKTDIEDTQLLTLEESIAIREEKVSEGERFTKALELKDKEISRLEKTINSIEKRKSENQQKKSARDVIFEDDFEYNKGWVLNYWGSTDPSKTNRIQGSTMIFQAEEQELTGRIKENGAYIDLRDGILNGKSYEISCKVKADPNTTMSFQLWVHDTIGGDPNASVREPSNFIIPTQQYETIKLIYTARPSNALRIHLHTKPGHGQIFVDKVRVIRL